MAVYELFVNDFFVMIEPGTVSNPSGIEVDQFLGFTETIRHNHKIGSVRQNFNPGQVVTVRTSIKNESVHDFLGMWNSGAKNLPPQTVVQIFAPYHKARKVYWEQVLQTLVMAQTINGPDAKPGFNTLEILQTVIANVVRSISVPQTLVMKTNGVGYILNPNFVPNPYVLGGPNGSPE